VICGTTSFFILPIIENVEVPKSNCRRCVEAELAPGRQIIDHPADAQLAPQATEDERRADVTAAGQDRLAALVRAQHAEFFGEAAQGSQQGVELAAGAQAVQAPQ